MPQYTVQQPQVFALRQTTQKALSVNSQTTTQYDSQVNRKKLSQLHEQNTDIRHFNCKLLRQLKQANVVIIILNKKC